MSIKSNAKILVPRLFLIIIWLIMIANPNILICKAESRGDIEIEWSIPLELGVRETRISANGKYAAITCSDFRGLLQLFDINKQTILWSYREANSTGPVSISDDGQFITFSYLGWASGGYVNPKLYLFDRSSNEPEWIYDLEVPVTGLMISGNGKYIVAGGHDPNKLFCFDTVESKLLWSKDVDEVLYGGQVSISNSGEYIAAGIGSKLCVFKKDSNIPFREFNLFDINPLFRILEVALSGDGSTVVASLGSKIHMFDVNEGIKIWSYDMINYGASRISTSYDGNFIAVAAVPTFVRSSKDYKSKIFVLDKDNKKVLISYGYSGITNSIDISDDGTLIVSGSQEGNVYFFERYSPEPIAIYEVGGYVGANSIYNSISVSADGSFSVAGSCGEKRELTVFKYNPPLAREPDLEIETESEETTSGIPGFPIISVMTGILVGAIILEIHRRASS